MRVARRHLLLAVVAACAPTPKHRIAVALVVDGDSARVGDVAPHAVAGLELQPFEVPAPTAPAARDDGLIAAVTKARAAYVDGEFEVCRRELQRVDLGRLLGAGQRALAGRTLAFDVACAFGAQDRAQSELLAGKLASLGLDLPDAPLAQDAETLIARAITEIGTAPRHELAVTGEIGGRLSIDGRPAGCTLPCTIDVPAGDHYVAVETDGFMPVARWVRVPDTTRVELAQQPATREVAAAQWRARVGRGLPAADAVGARLLARIAPQPRIALVHGGARLAGTLIVDGELRARGERASDSPALIRELAYDARVLKRPAVWQQPAFWITTSAAVAAIAGIVIYSIYEPEVESEVGF